MAASTATGLATEQRAIASRLCRTCGRHLSYTPEHFSQARHICKACTNARVQAWHDAHRDRIRQHKRKWAEANPEKGDATCRRYRLRHRGELRARARRHYAQSPEQVRIWVHNGRARQVGAEGQLRAGDLARRLKQQKGHCWWCGANVTIRDCHVDHAVPLSRGGENDLRNVVVACPACNMRKINNKMPEEFAGSGPAVISAEQTGRVCYGMEIVPRYCDIILSRWEAFTGGVAERAKG